MPGNVLRNTDGNSDEGDIRERAAGSGNAAPRNPPRDLCGFWREGKGSRRKSHLTDVDRHGYGFSRQPKAHRLAKEKTIVTWRHLAYVPHHRRAEFEALGWKVEDKLNGTHHGDWSCIGEWVGPEGQEPPMPVLRSDAEEHPALPVGTKC